MDGGHEHADADVVKRVRKPVTDNMFRDRTGRVRVNIHIEKR